MSVAPLDAQDRELPRLLNVDDSAPMGHTTFAPRTRETAEALSSSSADEVDMIPTWLTGVESQLHVTRVDESEQHEKLVRRVRWTAEHTKEDEQDALAVALTELLEEWEQF